MAKKGYLVDPGAAMPVSQVKRLEKKRILPKGSTKKQQAKYAEVAKRLAASVGVKKKKKKTAKQIAKDLV